MQTASGTLKQLVNFFREVRVELSRLEWPKQDEFVGATIVTLLFVAFFTVYFFLIDGIIRLIMHQIFWSGI